MGSIFLHRTSVIPLSSPPSRFPASRVQHTKAGVPLTVLRNPSFWFGTSTMAASLQGQRMTITPAPLRQALAESRSFERCAPTTPWHDRARPLAPPRRARGTCAAHICTFGHIHAHTVWGGCGGWGLACGSLTIHPLHAMGHERGVQFCLRHSHVHPPWQVSATLTVKSAEDQARDGDRFL